MNKTLWAFIFLLTSFWGHAYGESFSGRVVGIIDGDTIDVMRAGEMIRLRLQGINTPERGEPFYQKAKNHLAELVHGKTVVVKLNGKTTHGRDVGKVYVNGVDVNYLQVKEGYAWHCRNFLTDRDYAAAESASIMSNKRIHAEKTLNRPGWCVGE